MKEMNTILMDLPGSVKAFTVKKDDEYTIVLNARLSQEQRLQSYIHELDHIEHDDFAGEVEADQLEAIRH